MKTYNTTGIVLRRGDYRENDRLFVLFTRDHGKVSLVARGTKKILSKLNPHLEPMNEVSVMIAKGRGFDKLGNAIAIRHYSGIRKNHSLALQSAVSYVLEITERLVYERSSDTKMYDLLSSQLDFFDRQAELLSESQQRWFANVYALLALDHLGYRPEVFRCVECSKGMIFLQTVYDFMRGGLLCGSCRKVSFLQAHRDVSDSVIKMLRLSLTETPDTLTNYRFTEEDCAEFNGVVEDILSYHLDRELATLRFLREMVGPEELKQPLEKISRLG